MIFPEPRKDRLNQRGIAFFSTLVLAVVLYGLLLVSGVSIKEANRSVFREINLDGLLTRQIRLASVEAPNSSNMLNLVGSTPQSVQEETNDSVESEVEEEIPGEPVPEPNLSTPRQSQQVKPPEEVEVPEDEPPVASNQPSVEPEPIPEPEVQPGNNTVQAPIEASIEPEPATQTSGGAINSGKVSIERLSLAAFGADYKSLEIREIIDWMKQNPSELPKGIRQLVRFRPAFLSSVTSFNMDGKDYELYLMCKESLFEVHIVLVDEDEAIYLVDRSFQKLSTYLRKGKVRRTDDQNIVAVRSNMASSTSSDEFYSLFLSWWDWAQKAS